MKCKKLSIETDGTTTGTKVFVDGEQLGLVQRIEFSANNENSFVKISIEKSRIGADGKTVTKKVKIRDEKSQKFEDKDIISTEAILIEFQK